MAPAQLRKLHRGRELGELGGGRRRGMSDERLVEVEIKLAYLERHLTELDGVVRVVCDEIANLRRDVVTLQGQQSGQPGERPGLESEKPPHY